MDSNRIIDSLSEHISEPRETDLLSPEHQNNLPQQLSFKEKCYQFKSNITIEPMMVVFITAVMVSHMANQNMYLEKACRVNLNFSEEICDALERRETENYTSYEKEVQKLTAFTSGWKTMITTIVPSTLILFVGAYSDSTGRRKMFIMTPIIGEFLSSIVCIFHYYFFYQLPIEALALTEALLPSIGGGFCTMFFGIFSYISDVTSQESRTFRMGIVSFCMSVGFPLGMSLSGVLLKHFGYYTIYVIAASAHFCNICYGCFVLKDPHRPDRIHTKKVKFFNFKRVGETLSILWSGPTARNRRILLLLVTLSMLFGPMYGEMNVLYLSTRYRFNWELVSFSLYVSYNTVVHSVGTIFSIVVLSKMLKFHDSLLGIISTFSKMAGTTISGLAKTGQIFYLGPLVEILNGTSLLALRSMMSKLVTSEEQGKLHSIVGLVETAMPLVYAPLYVKVYSSTLHVFPGAVFFLSVALTFMPAVMFVYLFIEHRMKLKKNESDA